ncbi:hypothetical protein T484DRAFT_1868744 [Baffinella frigidus]|nr:hypothetical protein T484DRAFT_1868744 [Cryptophyta sp. CCMP2293]
MNGGFEKEETLSILEQASLLVFALLCALSWWWLRRSIERREESRRSKDLSSKGSSQSDISLGQKVEMNQRVFELGGRPVRSTLLVRRYSSGDSPEQPSPSFRRSPLWSDRTKESLTSRGQNLKNWLAEQRGRSQPEISEQPPSIRRCSSDAQAAAVKISRTPSPKGALELLRGGNASHYGGAALPGRDRLVVRAAGDSPKEPSPSFRRPPRWSDRTKENLTGRGQNLKTWVAERRLRSLSENSEQPPSIFGLTRCLSDTQAAAVKISRKPGPKGALEMLRGGATSHYSPRPASSYPPRRARSGE